MTDMHREAFEKCFADLYPITSAAARDGEKWATVIREHFGLGFQAALRYRDEQEKGDE